MAKRRTTAAKEMDRTEDEPEKTAFQVRFDPELHAEFNDLSERTGISMNQLIQGIIRGAIQRAIPGEPRIKEGFVGVQPTRKCVFFAERGRYKISGEYLEEYVAANGEEPPIANHKRYRRES